MQPTDNLLSSRKRERLFATLNLSTEHWAPSVIRKLIFDYAQSRWDTENVSCIQTLVGHSIYVFSLAAISDNVLLSGSLDNTIRIWNIEKGTSTKFRNGHSSSVNTLALNPSENVIISCSKDMIKVWDKATLTCSGTMKMPIAISSFTILSSTTCALGYDNNTIKVWDLKRRNYISTLFGHTQRVTTICLVSERLLASGSLDQTIKIWNLKKRRMETTLTGHEGGIRALTILPNGYLASGSSDKSIRIWNLSTLTCTMTLFGHTGSVRALEVLDGNLLISGSLDGTIRIWDLEDKICVRSIVAGTKVVSLKTLGSDRFAAGLTNGSIRIWSKNEI